MSKIMMEIRIKKICRKILMESGKSKKVIMEKFNKGKKL